MRLTNYLYFLNFILFLPLDGALDTIEPDEGEISEIRVSFVLFEQREDYYSKADAGRKDVPVRLHWLEGGRNVSLELKQGVVLPAFTIPPESALDYRITSSESREVAYHSCSSAGRFGVRDLLVFVILAQGNMRILEIEAHLASLSDGQVKIVNLSGEDVTLGVGSEVVLLKSLSLQAIRNSGQKKNIFADFKIAVDSGKEWQLVYSGSIPVVQSDRFIFVIHPKRKTKTWVLSKAYYKAIR